MVLRIVPESKNYERIFSFCAGLFATTLFSMFALNNPAQWVIIVHWVLVISSPILTLAFYFLDAQQKHLIQSSADAVMEELNLVGSSGADPGDPTLKIIEAKYGSAATTIDVTDQLNNLVQNNTINITVSNELFSDPIPGTVKFLYLKYNFKGMEYQSKIRENQNLIIGN